jgi:hypothetical protein
MLEDYLDICITKIHANRPRTHFNKTGWKNVINKFNEKTRKQYCYKQLKNKWDSLKKEWNIWKRLISKKTGLGCDPVKKTIDIPNDWWEKNYRYHIFTYLFLFKWVIKCLLLIFTYLTKGSFKSNQVSHDRFGLCNKGENIV